MGIENDLKDIFSLLTRFLSESTSPTSDKKPKSNRGGASSAVSRAREWVAAGVKYHGGVNGGKDFICGGTVKRPKNPLWDPYRTDCSGLVAWAWGQKPPGRTCSMFAPFDTSGSSQITVDELRAGDALNSGKHICLFVDWIDRNELTMRVIQATTCNKAASEDVVHFKQVNEKTLANSSGVKFYPIRRK